MEGYPFWIAFFVLLILDLNSLNSVLNKCDAKLKRDKESNFYRQAKSCQHLNFYGDEFPGH